ncbi:MAG: outer membrane protein assembly factor BamA [Gammaproteobacteria bacterium]|nr:outer membrane protein assembly factor BamA [Gammaproteobacteria bacterium]
MLNKNILLLAPLVCAAPVYAFEPFTVKDIRLDGLQRISIGTVFNYLPIKVGEKITDEDTTRAIHALYQTGFFKDVRIEREGDVLVIFVAERPAIADIKITGNSSIATDQLNKSLKDLGMVDGRIFDRSLLDNIEQELKRQYYSLGKYAVKVSTKALPRERNRVSIAIDIAEGDEAQIYAVNIVGNKTFSTDTLTDLIVSADRGIFGGRKNFNRQILAGDQETLRSYYMDRGYINFNIDSTQVALSPDKQEVYVTINISEGNRYTVREVKRAGNLLLPEAEYNKLIVIKTGDVFSRKTVIDTRKNISDRLAELGYPYANVNIAPNIDEDTRTVALTVFVDPGQRIYVRRVNIEGNNKTKDEVIRRELRQLEADWMSSKQVALSKQRLDRTGFFEEVTMETPAVPAAQDQVDLNVTVKERPTGSLTAGLGYSDTQGAIINFALTQENFMGTGKYVAVTVDNSKVTKTYNFSIRNPYYTEDGISRTFNIFERKIDAQQANVSNYVINTAGASVSYGVPSSEFSSYGYGVGYEHNNLVTLSTSATQILDFVAKHGNTYDTVSLTSNWVYDNRNRAIFATSGRLARVNVETTVPGGDLEYYKVGAKYLQYFPFTDDLSLAYNIEADYGTGYGKSKDLPPFKNYFAGGSNSVRGFDGNSLGPKDSRGEPLGGDRRLVSNLELFLPTPFAGREKSAKLSLFIDSGYVYGVGQPFDLGEMRAAGGLGLMWLTPIGALRFSLAQPIKRKPGDSTTVFQFSLGTAY